MKNYINKIVLSVCAALAVSMTSCSEDNVLNLEPYSSASENSAFSSKSMIELSVNGVYNAAQLGYYRNAPRGYPFGAAYFQQNDNRGEDVVNTQAFYQFTYTSTYNPSGSLNNIVYWEDSYKLINRCNIVLEGIADAVSRGVISKEDGDAYLGQVLFFRAFTHFELSKHFARPYDHTADASHPGVPLLTVASKNSETALANAAIGRATVKQVYDKVLEDLNDAEKKLEGQPKNILRVSKYASIALKTKVFLNMKRWADVIKEADKLNGQYSLADNPDTPFASPRNNTESIFSLDNSATNNPGVNAALASMYNGRLLIAISPIIWNSTFWPAADKRRDMVKTVGGAKFTNKYKDVATYTDPSPLLRYAEVLLNRAEAKARTGDASYLADLNAVRRRSTASVYAAPFGSAAAAVNAIIMEKRIEFLAEGMRWGDIHRLQNDDLVDYNGIPAKYANKTPVAADYVIGAGYTIKSSDLQAIPYSDYRFLWPIPLTETSVNPVLASQQNPGY